MLVPSDWQGYQFDETKGWNCLCALEVTLMRFDLVLIEDEWDYSEIAEFDEKYSPKS
jgi:hypothetical protein